MGTKVHKYNKSAAFLDFHPIGTSREELADHWGSQYGLADFFKSQAGVNGELKFWEFRCVHFPALDLWLMQKKQEALAKVYGNFEEESKIHETHPSVTLTTIKPDVFNSPVFPIWVVTTRPVSDEEIIAAALQTIDRDDKSSDWHRLALMLTSEDWTPGSILGLTKIEKATAEEIKEQNEDSVFLGSKIVNPVTYRTDGQGWTTESLTRAGDKYFGDLRKLERSGLRNLSNIYNTGVKWRIADRDKKATVFDDKVFHHINYFQVTCNQVDSKKLHKDRTFLRDIREAGENKTYEPKDFLNLTTLKNYRMPWTHNRVLEETSAFLNKDVTAIITDLIASKAHTVILDSVKQVLDESNQAQLDQQKVKYNKWRNALKAFTELDDLNFVIPESLESVSEVVKKSESRRRDEREDEALEGVSRRIDEIKWDLEKLVEAKLNKESAIDGGFYGEKPSGSTVMTGKDGFNVRRVTTLDFIQYKTVQDRVEKVMTASVHAANPFLFRGKRPVVVRVGQVKHTHTSGQDRSLHVDDYAGYEITAEKTEKVAAIIEEFNESLSSHLGPTPTLLWGNVTLTKEWVDFGNNWPLDELSPNQTYYIPDPRSLPAGDPPASQYPMTTG